MNNKEAAAAFEDYNQKQSNRTVRLTKLACQRLQLQGEKITLSAIYRVSQEFDKEKGKGIHPNSIRRNPKAYAIFLAYNPNAQKHQGKKFGDGQSSSHPSAKLELPSQYRNCEVSDLVELIEQMKNQITDLKKEREELKRKYEKARRLRDEALQQNTFQLARLTVLGIPEIEPARKTEPNSM